MKHIQQMLEKILQVTPPSELTDIYLQELLIHQSFLGLDSLTFEDEKIIQKGLVEISLYSKVTINKVDINITSKDTISDNKPISEIIMHLSLADLQLMMHEIYSGQPIEDFVDEHAKALDINISPTGKISYQTKPFQHQLSKIDLDSISDSPYKYFNIFPANYYFENPNLDELRVLGYATSKFLEKYDFYNLTPEKQAEFVLGNLLLTSRVHSYIVSDSSSEFTNSMYVDKSFLLFLAVNQKHNPKLLETIYSEEVMNCINNVSQEFLLQICKQTHIPSSVALINPYRIYDKHGWSSEMCDDIICYKSGALSSINPIPSDIFNKEYINILQSIFDKFKNNHHLFTENITIIKDRVKISKFINVSDTDSFYLLLSTAIESLVNSYNVNDNPYYSPLLHIISKTSQDQDNLSFLDKYIMTLAVIICFDEMDDSHHVEQLESFFSFLDEYMFSDDKDRVDILETLTLQSDFKERAKADNFTKLELANILFCKLESNSKMSSLAEYKIMKKLKTIYFDEMLNTDIPANQNSKSNTLKF